MKVLLVEDDTEKAREVATVLEEAGLDADRDIEIVVNAHQALQCLRNKQYELLVLDLVLPLRLQEPPVNEGGKRILEAIYNQSAIRRPQHIVGLTVSEEALSISEPEFNRGLWTVARYGPDTLEWKDQLTERAKYILARTESVRASVEHQCDVLFVCALKRPELSQLMNASGTEWTPLRIANDPSSYLETCLSQGGRPDIRLVACHPPSMGLVAAATLTSKACMHLSPRIVVMSGICAGRRGEVNLGDVVVANTTWDYGSGKFVGRGEGVEFQANPYQLPIEPDVNRVAEDVASDDAFLTTVSSKFAASRPDTRLQVRLGPMASGAAVQAYDAFFETLARQNRKVLAIDMEAFAISWAAREATEPRPVSVIVKGVSDFADGDKSDAFHDYASFSSASVALELVKRMIWD